MIMHCAHCKEELPENSALTIFQNNIVHLSCVNEMQKFQAGLTHKCPVCKGTGYEITEKMVSEDCTRAQAQEAAGYAGAMYPQYYKVEVLKQVRTKCMLCFGDGYLEKEPIIRLSTTSRFERG